MKTIMKTAGLLLPVVLFFQGCTHHPIRASAGAETDAWQNCAATDARTCPSKELTGETAKNLLNALTNAGVEMSQSLDIRTISVHDISCAQADGKFDCSLGYHKPSSELSGNVAIKDGSAAKHIYQALAAAGVREDCVKASCTITLTSAGCMDAPPKCQLAKNSYEEVAW
ncbi:MAG: hypothetical protein A2X29_09705 [Elusimicrobia bacterium GWA2_64_40]|nr:MAG: hypothetical protein A2X29_09705 [Elusimicrobia bacterium GWA2_64_40]OGR62591.1 MAG: hypothetical protein A2X30_08125 [Elusimicrobia bacterium GWB2_63_16]